MTNFNSTIHEAMVIIAGMISSLDRTVCETFQIQVIAWSAQTDPSTSTILGPSRVPDVIPLLFVIDNNLVSST